MTTSAALQRFWEVLEPLLELKTGKKLKDIALNLHIYATNKNDEEFKRLYDPTKRNILHIPTGTIEIENYAFVECTGLTEVHFPHDIALTEICSFESCTDVHCSAEFQARFRSRFLDDVNFHLI